MKVRFESDDGMVSGYGDEGKAAVEAHEADPLARFLLPWEWDGKLVLLLNRDGFSVPGEQFRTMALLGSRLAPLAQEAINQADISWHREWRSRKPEVFYYKALIDMEQALNETLNG